MFLAGHGPYRLPIDEAPIPLPKTCSHYRPARSRVLPTGAPLRRAGDYGEPVAILAFEGGKNVPLLQMAPMSQYQG